jgi:hypothetical protein
VKPLQRRFLRSAIALVPCYLALLGCFDSPGTDSIGGAPTCNPKEGRVSGSLDQHDEGIDGSVSSYSLSQSPVASSVDFEVQGKGHVHLEWRSTGAEGHEVIVSKGTFVSPTSGTIYCVGPSSKVVLTKTGGQFELTDLKVGDCPGTKDVDGTIDGCFDGG